MYSYIKGFSSGMFGDVGWEFVTDVSGQHLSHQLHGGSLNPRKVFYLFPNQERAMYFNKAVMMFCDKDQHMYFDRRHPFVICNNIIIYSVNKHNTYC